MLSRRSTVHFKNRMPFYDVVVVLNDEADEVINLDAITQQRIGNRSYFCAIESTNQSSAVSMHH